MKSILFALLLTLAACAAPMATPEDTSSTSQAIDKNPPPPVTSKPILITVFEKIPPLPAVQDRPLPHDVINIAPILREPGIVWGLNTKPANVAPVYVTCGPEFQSAQDLCYLNYHLSTNACDTLEITEAQDCQNELIDCQTGYCSQQYFQCVAAAECDNTSCIQQSYEEEQQCTTEESVCETYIETSGAGPCAFQFTGCVGQAEAQDGSCRSFAASTFDTCSGQVGTCF